MDSQRRRAERIVQELLERTPIGVPLDSDSLVEGQPPELRTEIERLLADFALVRDSLREAGPASGGTAEAPGLRPGMRLGDFRLLREIGRGGMAAVWEAEQRSLGRTVALKLLRPPPGLEAARVARFLREAEVAGRIAHRNVVTVFAVGEAEGLHFIAMELVPGGRTLAHAIEEWRARAELPAAHARTQAVVVATVAEALAAAHAQGVVHRDIKPGNVLLAHDGEPLLADFGLAALADSPRISVTGELLGTPFYMAPEAAEKSGHVDPRSDVFSLGAVLYELLTLRRPFEGDSVLAVLAAVRRDEPLPPHRVSSRVPRELSTICLHALEKRPEQRYASAADLAADLRRWLRHEPIVARPPGPVRRATQWTRRHPVASVAAAGLVVSLVLLGREHVARAEAVRQTTEADVQRGEAVKQTAEANLQRGEAVRQRDEAQHQAQTARAVTDWVKRLFQESSPSETLGRDPPLSEVVEHGLADLDTLTGQPAVHADVATLVGQLLYSVGRYDRAEALFRTAHDERAALYGADDDRTLEVTGHLADVADMQGHHEEAAQLAREAAAAGDAGVRLAARGSLAGAQMRLGQLDEAEQQLRALIPDLTEAFGADFHLVLTTRGSLANVLTRAGRPEEARALLEPLLADWRRLHGPDDPGSLYTENLLGNALNSLGRRADAEAQYRDLVERAARVLGENHTLTAGALYNLAAAVEAGGDRDEARGFYERAVASGTAVMGPDNPQTIVTVENLAILYARSGRPADAEPLFQRALESRRRTEGPTGDGTLKALYYLGVLFASSERPELAEAAYLEVIETAELAGPRTMPRRLMSLVNLLLMLQAQGRIDDAERLAASVELQPAPDVPMWHQVRWMRGELLMDQGRMTDAECALRATFADADGRPGPASDFALGALTDLGDTLVREGRWDDARDVLRETRDRMLARNAQDPRLKQVGALLQQAADAQGCVVDA